MALQDGIISFPVDYQLACMKKNSLFFALMAFTLIQVSAQRTITNFDGDWKFIQSDLTNAQEPSLNVSSWRTVSLPHDWMIEGAYDRNNPTARGGGYLPAGIGWYRKTFTVPASDAKKIISVEFDGVMANCEVYVNGKLVGKRPYGYISFAFTLNQYLNFGKPNTIAVRADNSVQPASRYYTGAGIYRHVRLVSTQPSHLKQWGVFVTTPNATEKKSTIKISSQISQEANTVKGLSIQTTIVDANNVTVATTTKSNLSGTNNENIFQETTLTNAKLWNLESTYMYQAITKLYLNKELIDEVKTAFGIREAKFEAATGFWLNGKNLKLKGVCLHHDGGAVGSAVPLGVWEERFKLLKQAGVNAIRTSHNPVAPEFLDLCDRMGFLVMDETFDTWTSAKHNGEKGYNLLFKEWWAVDTRDMVLRDRNHPSIVIYSVGNEIHDDLSYPKGFQVYKDQQDMIHLYDSTRPVTMALFRPANSKVYLNGFAEHMEVVGQNYREKEIIVAHENNPHWKVIGTENTHVLDMWLALRDKPYLAGQFLWTGIDYLGEEDWPAVTNSQGLFDRAGNWKQQSLQRQSWWSDEPVVHIMRKSDNAGAGVWVNDWTPTDFDTYDNAKINVYSNCDEVELFLNDKSLGAKTKPVNDSPRDWDCSFEKGTIKAVGKNKGVVVVNEILRTAGKPAKLQITLNKNTVKNTWDDVVFASIQVLDETGILCPNADNLVKFDLTGEGSIAGLDNGDINSHESFQAKQRQSYKGRSIAIVKATAAKGSISIKVSAEGLTSTSATIAINGQ